MKQKNNPFDNLVLDSEEQELEKAFERGEYEEVRSKKIERMFK